MLFEKEVCVWKIGEQTYFQKSLGGCYAF